MAATLKACSARPQLSHRYHRNGTIFPPYLTRSGLLGTEAEASNRDYPLTGLAAAGLVGMREKVNAPSRFGQHPYREKVNAKKLKSQNGNPRKRKAHSPNSKWMLGGDAATRIAANRGQGRPNARDEKAVKPNTPGHTESFSALLCDVDFVHGQR